MNKQGQNWTVYTQIEDEVFELPLQTALTLLLEISTIFTLAVPASVAQLDARPTDDQEVAGSTPPGQQHSSVGIDHEIPYKSRHLWCT